MKKERNTWKIEFQSPKRRILLVKKLQGVKMLCM